MTALSIINLPPEHPLAATTPHQEFVTIVADLRRSHIRILSLLDAGAETLDLDATNTHCVQSVAKFLAFLHQHAAALKGDGLPLSAIEAARLTGRHAWVPLDAARKACLTRVRGNRRLGEIDCYQWCQDGVNALSLFYARALAIKQSDLALEAQRATQELLHRFEVEGALNVGHYEYPIIQADPTRLALPV